MSVRGTLRSAVRAVRPNPKRWYGNRNPRSWIGLVTAVTHERLSAEHVLAGVEILRRGRSSGRYMATLPRAGFNYLTAILTSASEVEEGRSGEYRYVPGAAPTGHGLWIHDSRLYWSPVPGTLAHQLKRFYRPPLSANMYVGSHYPLDRGMLDPTHMRPVLVVRDIFDALASWMKHAGFSNDEHDAFFARGIPDKAIEYFNYWGAFLEDRLRVKRTDQLCIHYEELIADPMPSLRAIRDLWQLDIGDRALARGLELNARERMESKVSGDADNKRVTLGEKIVFHGANRERILSLVQSKLRYDFGYVYH